MKNYEVTFSATAYVPYLKYWNGTHTSRADGHCVGIVSLLFFCFKKKSGHEIEQELFFDKDSVIEWITSRCRSLWSPLLELMSGLWPRIPLLLFPYSLDQGSPSFFRGVPRGQRVLCLRSVMSRPKSFQCLGIERASPGYFRIKKW
jgi:hypothetical protein